MTPTTIQSGNNHVIIQGIGDNEITLNVNGEVRQIQNQLEELKGLLSNLKVQNVQYAEKIYNIEHIDEANFGLVTGKRPFNELLARKLIEAIAPYSQAAQRFLEKVTGIAYWETQARISDKAKEIISYSFVGVIGIQLSKLMAIGKEDLSEAKQRKYIEKSVQIAKRSLDLVCFAMLSRCWDALQQSARPVSEAYRKVLHLRLDHSFEPSILELFQLLQALDGIFQESGTSMEHPIEEIKGLGAQLQNGSELDKICQALQALNEKLDKSQFNLLDCHEAESQLAAFFCYFNFLVNYRMASIKRIGYRQVRNETPRYLHSYAALGIDSKANVDAEKLNYTDSTVHTDSVLLYRGDNYRVNVNLSPFVLDYNALALEHGSRICFFRSQSIDDDGLEFHFLDDNSLVRIAHKGIIKPETDLSELMMSTDNLKIINLDCIVEQFEDARRCLLDDGLNLDEI